MTIIDWLARDRVSRYICTGITLVFLGAGLFAAQQGRDASARDAAAQIDGAQAQARNIANTVLFTSLSYATVTAPISAPLYRDMMVGLESQAFTDRNVARIRVWRPDGLLQFSTRERDQVGILQTVDTTLIDEAMKGRSVSVKVFTRFNAATTGTAATATNLLEVFVPLHVPDRISVAGVAEIDYYYDSLVHPLPHPWFKLMMIFGSFALLSLILTLLSFSERLRTLVAGSAPRLSAGPVWLRRGRERAPAPPADRAAKAQQPDAELALARATKAEAEVVGLREQLAELGDRLRQAEEAYHLLGAKMFLGAKGKRRQAGEAANATLADTTHMDELKASRARAEAQLAAMATGLPDAVRAESQELTVAAELRSEDQEAKPEDLNMTQAPAEAPTDAKAPVSPGDLRARLARTAARKKPGARAGRPRPAGPERLDP